MANLEDISDFIAQLPHDYRAEFLLALFESEIRLRDLLITTQGQLKRTWSKDIFGTSVEQLTSGNELLNILVNRDGIYDQLPEAMFHDMTGSDCATGNEMAKESMRLKMQEKESRLFFQPLENEVFIQGVQLAANENQLLQRIYAQKLVGLIPQFWKIAKNIPEQLAMRLIKFIPMAHIITGNVELTAQCLQLILDEQVSIKVAYPDLNSTGNPENKLAGILGKCNLGNDFVIGNYVSGEVKKFIIHIGPIKNSETFAQYTDGALEKFLSCFYSYFIPLEIDTTTNFLLDDEDGIFSLHGEDENKISYLGYNSVIQ